MGRRVNNSVVVYYTSLCLHVTLKVYSLTTILTASGQSATSEVQDEPQYAELTDPPIYTEPTMTSQEPSSSEIPQGHSATSNVPTSPSLGALSQAHYAQPETSPKMASVHNPTYFYTEPYVKTEVKCGFIRCT